MEGGIKNEQEVSGGSICRQFFHGEWKSRVRDFPGGPAVRVPCSHCRGPGFIPGGGTKLPQAVQCSQKKKKKKSRVILERHDELVEVCYLFLR